MMPRTSSLVGLFRLLGLHAIGLAAGLAAGRLGAQEAAPPRAPAGAVIRTIQQFWDLTPEARAREQEFDLECTVTFFDPFWRILFVQDKEGSAAYVPYGNNPYAFKAGESIRARGRFNPPSVDVAFDQAVVTPLDHVLPLKPLAVSRDILQHTRYVRKYVSVEGFVDRERRSDKDHLQLSLTVNGESVICWVMTDPSLSTPDLLDQKVRVEGVYNPKVGPDGLMSSLEIMVPSLAQVRPLGRIDEDPAYKIPVTPIGSLRNVSPDQLVRVAGVVVSRDPGHSVRIRDSSGQIDLMTGQMRPLAVNDSVEAVGYPDTSGAVWLLHNAIFRAQNKLPAPAYAPGEAPGTIGLAADVLSLSPSDAAQARPVHLVGVVTWSQTAAPFFFIHDSSGGICIMRGKSDAMLRSPGRNVEVFGVTAMGAFAPVVVATNFERVSDTVLPVARQVSMEHVLTGIEEAQWIELRGYLRRVYQKDGWNCLEVATATDDFIAMLPETEDVSSMVGSVIRVQGVCTADADAQRKLTGIRLWVPGVTYVQVEEPAPADLFSLPVRSLASLGQYETVQAFNRRLRVTGVVLHHSPGHSIRLEENGHSLLVLSRAKGPLQPGDQIEAVGFLGRQAGRVVLREAVYRRTGAGHQPEPRFIRVEKDPSSALDGQLVTVEASLIGLSQAGDVMQITLQSGAGVFGASLEGEHRQLTGLVNGSRLALTGVYEVEFDEHARPASFVLRLRSPADVAVLDTPSWWTRARILAFTGVIALGALLFLGWVTVLRRQVQEQTGQIRGQMEREARLQADLARAGKLESLGLLAGGIAHDFNNLLTVLMGNISLIRTDPGLTPDSAESLAQAEKAASRARDLTQQLLTFAKGGAPIRSAVSLPEVVREVAEFALRGSTVRCQFALPSGLWPANVDKGQIGQVVQNIVINSIQAMPEGGQIEIALSNHEVGAELGGVLAVGRYVRLDITDHGPGIPAADLGRIFDPYFTTKKQGSGLGLATVHSIVKKHAGHITADSVVGQGTTFHIWLPAADAAAAPVADTAPPSPVLTAAAGSARVLVMDDEEFIRNLASSILRRQGHLVKAVNDGAAALQEYVRAREAAEPYDLVILDLTIPGGMGGRQAMEELRRIDPAVRAIVSSGYSNDLVLANYQAHGFRGMISKPYDVTDFAHAVERVLKGQRA